MKFDHDNNFDLIRLFAALQVVEFHVSSVLDLPVRPAALGFVFDQFPGVAVFFVVSGFLVTRSYLYGGGGLAAYFARRALRIYPALWVNLSVIVLLLAVTGSLILKSNLIPWLAVSFALGSEICGNFIVGLITQPAGFYPKFPSGVTWTLVVEIGFYILLPLIFIGKFREVRFAWLSLLAWAILSLAVAQYYFRQQVAAPDAALTKLLSVNVLTDLWEFLLGAACSIYWDRVKRFFEGRFLWWLAVYLAAALAMKLHFGVDGLNTHTNTPLMPLMTALMAGVVVSFAFTWCRAASVLQGNDFSYGIYLYHLPIVITAERLGMAGHGAMWFVVFAGTIACAALSWYCVERPALRLKARIARWLAHLETQYVRLFRS